MLRRSPLVALPCLAALLLVLASWAAAAPDDGAALAGEARTVLARCLACHGPHAAAREGDLGLHTNARLRGGAEAVVQPGDPAGSELLRRVTSADPRERMPPPDAGDALSDAEVDTLERWIRAGAPWTRHWAYTAWRDVTPPAVDDPAGFVRDDLDRFVLARLAAAGLAPSPPAELASLVRRVSLDLVGMPPGEEQLRRVLADPRPDAYERWVDELLASPHHAETWARHWLDLARYADSHGFTIDGGRSMWPWRDQVVRAIERDQPFDAFSIEQLAGDLLPDATREQRVASGFHRNTQVNQEGGAKDEENRLLAVIDRVDTTGAVWMGTTLGCARCHDHKLDPISQREYYALLAFFDSTADGGVSAEPALAVGSADDEAALAAWERERARLDGQLAALERDAAGPFATWQPARAVTSNGAELRPLEDGSYRSLGQNPEYSVYTFEGRAPRAFDALRLEALPHPGLPSGGPGRAGNGNAVLQELRVSVRAGDGRWAPRALVAAAADVEQDTRATGGGRYPAAALIDGDRGTGWAWSPHAGAPHVAVVVLAEPLPAGSDMRVELVQEHGGQHVLGRARLGLASLRGGAPADAARVPPAWSDAWRARLEHERARPSLPTTLVMQRRDQPRTTRVLVRGDPQRPGEAVQPGVPAALDRVGFDTPPRTRLDLARWLVHPDNALTWRVTANRWWQQLFGAGLVETEADFGQGGERPSHPELLEWLARRLVDDGFSRRAWLRRVVTSGTYRQASAPRAGLVAADPRNRLLARQARPRLTAEAVRDSALRASGLLDPRRFGPPVQPPQPDGVFDFTQSRKRWEADTGGDRYRRTLYTRLWRSSPHPFLTTFDLPSPSVTCTRRTRSNTPLQALTLANDPMILELAEALGERARDSEGLDGIARAVRLCLAREPTEAEHERLLEHLERVRELRVADGADAAEAERAAWTSLARVLFNLPEFQVRP